MFNQQLAALVPPLLRNFLEIFHAYYGRRIKNLTIFQEACSRYKKLPVILLRFYLNTSLNFCWVPT